MFYKNFLGKIFLYPNLTDVSSENFFDPFFYPPPPRQRYRAIYMIIATLPEKKFRSVIVVYKVSKV